ncbi:hypothetical protein [Bacillus weihaiensis]|uniref:hypothetical protein n=1 Tax=Bacillus weihaiensis TaxID=1547283 RepID=UPI00235524C2|nr:hypothetical protein [Bacillus weihaiensis]
MFGLYLKNKKVMGLSYKPDIGDVIRNDENNKFYKVLKLEGRKVYSRITFDPRMYESY